MIFSLNYFQNNLSNNDISATNGNLIQQALQSIPRIQSTVPSHLATAQFDLRDILNSYSCTKRILRNYERNVVDYKIVHRQLSDVERKHICKTLVFWAIDADIMFRKNDYPYIFNSIKMVFQEELYSLYYTPSSSYVKVHPITKKLYRKQSCPMGTLYNCWKYRIRLTREEEKALDNDVSRYYVNKKSEEKEKIDAPEFEATIVELKKWLSYSFDPWSLVVENWRKTLSLRAVELNAKTYNDVIAEWPQYKRKTAYELLDIDFNYLFPEKDTFKHLWSTYRRSIIDLALTQKKNKDLQHKVELADISRDEEKNMEGVIALHALFALLPNKMSNAKKNLNKIIRKANAGSKLNEIVMECSREATDNNFGPVIIYYENEDFLPYKFFICLNETVYETSNIVSAIDLLFKIVLVFDLGYCEECKVLCTFIQHFFFNIYMQKDFRGTSLIKWMAKLDITIGKEFEQRILKKDFDVKVVV